MKRLLLPLVLLSLIACKNNKEQTLTETESAHVKKELTIAQKIANAHGFEHWDKVKEFHFTFGGKAEDANSGRSWIWNPKTDDITLNRGGETFSYNRQRMDTTAIKNDRAFINDKFWALIPFQLVWDTNATISESLEATSPVKGETLNKITITYSNEGGYTPGDAYDIYYDNDFIIREWSFRRANQAEPSLSNTFEKYDNFNGILVAQEHKKVEGDWNLLIRNVRVELED
jgi:hypothetical protein